MTLQYIGLFYLIGVQICSSQLLLPFSARHKAPSTIPAPSSKVVGDPLIVTTLVKSNQVTKARKLSAVKPLLKNIVSNAGYFTVDEKYNSNLFFWFFRKTGDDWKQAPLLLWLQGGPGCGSINGLFVEHGPFMVTKSGLKRRKYAWTNDYNVLYIDQPVGTGYSFTNSSSGYVDNQEKIADHLYEALTQFFQLYAELKNNEFYITGESYAGKYTAALGYRIHSQKLARKCSINLKGLFIISGLSDPVSMCHNAEYSFKIGVIDSQTKDELHGAERKVESFIRSKMWKNALETWDDVLTRIQNTSHLSLYDYTLENLYYGNDEYIPYVQSAEIRRKIHVGNTTFDYCSDEVYEFLYADVMKSVKPWIEELLEHYPVAYVGGQFDLIVAYPMVVDFLEKLQWSGAKEYLSSKRNILYDGHRVVGYSKSGGNLKDIYVRRAGHMVPADQPRVTLNILKKFTSKKL